LNIGGTKERGKRRRKRREREERRELRGFLMAKFPPLFV
jgi:hypothetical protein